MKTILGIDVGMKGALSFYDENELIIYDMPIFKVKKGLALDVAQLVWIIQHEEPDEAYVEKALLMPANGKSAYQKLGYAEGVIVGILSALKVPYTIVHPRTWKASMKTPKDKDAARMRASQLLPEFAHNWPLKKDDGKAEASLIALYGYNRID